MKVRLLQEQKSELVNPMLVLPGIYELMLWKNHHHSKQTGWTGNKILTPNTLILSEIPVEECGGFFFSDKTIRELFRKGLLRIVK
jgi:hypothetical protein